MTTELLNQFITKWWFLRFMSSDSRFTLLAGHWVSTVRHAQSILRYLDNSGPVKIHLPSWLCVDVIINHNVVCLLCQLLYRFYGISSSNLILENICILSMIWRLRVVFHSIQADFHFDSKHYSLLWSYADAQHYSLGRSWILSGRFQLSVILLQFILLNWYCYNSKVLFPWPIPKIP